MRHFLPIATALVLFATPLHAEAKQTTVWSFRDGNVPGEWIVKTLSPGPAPTDEGLLFQSQTEGHIQHAVDLPHRIDLIEIDYLSTQNAELLLLFHGEDGRVFQMPFDIQASSEQRTALTPPQVVRPDMTSFDNWNPDTDMIGIAIPANLRFVIRSISVSSLNPLDKGIEMTKGIFRFDTAKPYMINFLWGPRLVFTQAEREALFTRVPPPASSVNWLLYGIMGIAVIKSVGLVLHGSWRRQRAIVCVVAVISVLWVGYDLRMGAEFTGYLRDDFTMYWSQPPESRVFRVRRSFNAFAESMRPILMEVPEYAFVASDENFVDYMRYITYPSLPVEPEKAGTGTLLYLVFERPDALISEDNRLTLGTGFQTSPGEVVAAYDYDSFLFRVNP